MKIVINVPDYPQLSEEGQIALGQYLGSTVTAYLPASIGVKFLDDDDIDDAICTAMLAHESEHDTRCSCGATNNMDGDVLSSHRQSVVCAAVDDLISVSPSP